MGVKAALKVPPPLTLLLPLALWEWGADPVGYAKEAVPPPPAATNPPEAVAAPLSVAQLGVAWEEVVPP